MSGEFRRIYPPKEPTLFDGGMNNKFERSIIQDSESPDCANVVFQNGAVETRQGSQKLNTAAIGSFVFDGLYTRRVDTGAETMIAFAGGSAWQLTGTSFSTIPSAQSVFTIGVRVAASQYENHMFVGNGGVIPYKWNGAAFTRHGVYPPTTTSTVTSQNTGVLTGDYRYKVTNVNSQLVESDVGPVTVTFTAASATLRITSIPVAPQSFGISTRKLYRTVTSGSAFKFVATINDNSTTTYDDNSADSALGVDAPTDNGVPPNYSCIVYHQNRLFMNDPNNPNFLWYTELGEPYTVKVVNFKKVGDQSSDIIKGLSVYNNGVVVWCEKSICIEYMPSTDPSKWQEIRIQTPYGSKSPFCFLDYGDKQLFVAMQNDKLVGFGALKGSAVSSSASLLTVSSAGSDLKSDRIEPEIFDIQEGLVGNISGIVFKNRAYLSVTDGSGSTTNNRIWMMDFSISNLKKSQEESWAPWTGLNAAQFTIYGGNLYFGSSTANGFVYRLEAGVYNDDGAAINSYFWTKEYGGYSEDVVFHKDFRRVNLLVDNSGDYFMDFTRRVDSDTGGGDTTQISLNPGGSLWGFMVWGRDPWGGGTAQREVRIPLGNSRGRRIQFKFSNQNKVDQKFKVHWKKFEYNLKGSR